MTRSVITLALGRQVFIDMAVALARSFKIWNNPNELPFYIATDNSASFPPDIKKWVHFIVLQKGELGEGFSPKLNLDKIAPTAHTLFIDADCLLTASIDFVFDMFVGKPVSVIGGYISKGDWFGDISSICRKFSIAQMPKFNGGVYYLEKGAICTTVYNKARELEDDYFDIGFSSLKGCRNDEVLMSLSMALLQQTPIDDLGSVMRTPIGIVGKLKIDCLKGQSGFNKWGTLVSPVIVHFCGSYAQGFHYKREVFKLSLFNKFPFFGKYVIANVVNMSFNTKYAIYVFFKRCTKVVVRRAKSNE